MSLYKDNATIKKFIVLFTLGLCIRALFVIFFKGQGDPWTNEQYLISLHKNINPVGIIPYLPNHFVFVYMAHKLIIHLGMHVSFWLKIFFCLSELGIMYFLYNISREILKNDRDKSLSIILFYWLNPLAIMLNSIHGQWDGIVFMFILACIYYNYQIKDSLYRAIILGILGLMAIYTKPYAILFMPLIAASQRNVYSILLFTFVIGLGLCFSFYSIKNLENVKILLNGIKSYGPVHHVGFGKFLLNWNYFTTNESLISWMNYIVLIWGKISKLLIILVSICIAFFIKEKSLLFSIYALIMLMLTISPSIAQQYLYWTIPFLAIFSTRSAYIFSVLSFVWIISFSLYLFYVEGFFSTMWQFTYNGQILYLPELGKNALAALQIVEKSLSCILIPLCLFYLLWECYKKIEWEKNLLSLKLKLNIDINELKNSKMTRPKLIFAVSVILFSWNYFTFKIHKDIDRFANNSERAFPSTENVKLIDQYFIHGINLIEKINLSNYAFDVNKRIYLENNCKEEYSVSIDDNTTHFNWAQSFTGNFGVVFNPISKNRIALKAPSKNSVITVKCNYSVTKIKDLHFEVLILDEYNKLITRKATEYHVANNVLKK